LVPITMKSAAKCDKQCELQNSANHQILVNLLYMEGSPQRRPSQEDKKAVADRLIRQNPNYVPLEIQKNHKSTLKCFDKKNILVPCSFPFYLVIEDIRKRIGNLEKSQALFCYINNSSVVKSDTTILELYNKFKSDDGFLHIEFSDVNAYG